MTSDPPVNLANGPWDPKSVWEAWHAHLDLLESINRRGRLILLQALTEGQDIYNKTLREAAGLE